MFLSPDIESTYFLKQAKYICFFKKRLSNIEHKANITFYLYALVNPHLWGAHIRRMYKCAIVVFSKTKIAATRKPFIYKIALWK
ncbi:hypothetical protein DSO22_23040 [Salmonella enterica]|nr:hypothetical protein [Salmonella enterica]EBO0463885.1 hypothetical protein [Salmonella enterica]MGE59657.1 hypothetical protein [Salmonella enterica]OLP49962.1 hypothetical protein BJM39_21915 [Salmonella enterica subsp. enterica serovar Javiana]